MCTSAGLWAAIFVGSLSTPALLDDADATHAQAAQAMLQTGDWVTLHVNGCAIWRRRRCLIDSAASLWVFQAQDPAHVDALPLRSTCRWR